MDLDRLYDILRETTRQFRKGDAIVERSEATEIFDMPHVDAADAALTLVDVVFLNVGVDKARAEARKADLVALLRTWPQPERLAAGPSYIEAGAVVGDQGAALSLFALGSVLGLWKLVTPALFGVADEAKVRWLAGNGLVMITGFAG